MNFYEHWVHVTRIGVDSLEPFSDDEWGYVADETGLGYYCPMGDDIYVVTHLASGYGVANVANEEHARALIEAIAPLTDWTQPAKAIFALPELPTHIQQAIKTVTGIEYKSTKKRQKLVQVARAIAEQAS